MEVYFMTIDWCKEKLYQSKTELEETIHKNTLEVLKKAGNHIYIGG